MKCTLSDDRNKESAMGECKECKVHDLVKSDFIGDISSEELPNSAESSSEEEENGLNLNVFSEKKITRVSYPKSKWFSM